MKRIILGVATTLFVSSVMALMLLMPTAGAQQDQYQDTSQNQAQPQNQSSRGTRQTQANWSISIEDSFDPADAAISSGDTVMWINQDDEPHTVTAYDGSFDSGTLNPGDTYTHTFSDPGTVSYYCTIHPRMVGSITVS